MDRKLNTPETEQTAQDIFFARVRLLVALVLVAAGVLLIFLLLVQEPQASNSLHPQNYTTAVALQESGRYVEAAQLFEELGDYEDAPMRLVKCKMRLANVSFEAGDYEAADKACAFLVEHAENRHDVLYYQKMRAKIAMERGYYPLAIATFISQKDFSLIRECQYRQATDLANRGEYQLALDILNQIPFYEDTNSIAARCHYQLAESQLAAGALEEAYQHILQALAAAQAEQPDLQLPRRLGDAFWDSGELSRAKDCYVLAKHLAPLPQLHAQLAEANLAQGNYAQAAMYFSILGERTKSLALWELGAKRLTLQVGSLHALAIKNDGTVVANGFNQNGQCDVSHWRDIVAISAGGYHSVGLKKDGTVVAVGNNKDGQCDVTDWTDIVAISADSSHTIGLKSDGTVVATGLNNYGQCDVSDWTDIIDVHTDTNATFGKKADGTILSTQKTFYLSEKNEIALNSRGYDATYYQYGSLKVTPEGTVQDKYGRIVPAFANYTMVIEKESANVFAETLPLTNIAAISSNGSTIAALKTDGTVLIYSTTDSPLKTSKDKWTNIRLPGTPLGDGQ